MKRTRWAFPLTEHDYRADFDYEPARVSRADRRLISALSRDLHAKLLPALGLFRRFRIAFAELAPNLLARYADGTHSEPVVVLDVEANRRAADRAGVGFELAIATSLLHELGHAIQACAGAAPKECGAEAFARAWYEDGYVEPAFARMAARCRRNRGIPATLAESSPAAAARNDVVAGLRGAA